MLKRRCGDGGNYGRAAPLTTTREREPVFITKSKTDSSPFPVRPACLAEHNIFWRNNVDAVCLGNNGPKQYPIPPRWRGHGYRPPFPRPTLHYSLFPSTKESCAGKRLGWILATNIFFHLADLSLNFAKMHSPPLGRFFSQIMIYTWFIRVIIEFYFISHPPRNRLLYSILPKLIDRRIT